MYVAISKYFIIHSAFYLGFAKKRFERPFLISNVFADKITL